MRVGLEKVDVIMKSVTWACAIVGGVVQIVLMS